MRLHAFLFDPQRLKAALMPFGTMIDEVILEVDERFTNTTDAYAHREQDANVSDWDLQHLAMANDASELDNGSGRSRYSWMVTTIRLQRRCWQLVWAMLVPLLVLVSVVWSILWVDIDSLPDRLNIAFIGLLTIVACQFVVLDDVPRSSFLTFTDSVLLVSFMMMAATVPQSLLIHGLVRKGRQQRAMRTDRAGRWALPADYLMLLVATPSGIPSPRQPP